jgi:hypothetical protein
LRTEKIGNWIGRQGVENLIQHIDPAFTPYGYWATKNQVCAESFWKPGTWDYENAAYFGAPPGWLDNPGRILNAKAKKEAGQTEDSDHE